MYVCAHTFFWMSSMESRSTFCTRSNLAIIPNMSYVSASLTLIPSKAVYTQWKRAGSVATVQWPHDLTHLLWYTQTHWLTHERAVQHCKTACISGGVPCSAASGWLGGVCVCMHACICARCWEDASHTYVQTSSLYQNDILCSNLVSGQCQTIYIIAPILSDSRHIHTHNAHLQIDQCFLTVNVQYMASGGLRTFDSRSLSRYTRLPLQSIPAIRTDGQTDSTGLVEHIAHWSNHYLYSTPLPWHKLHTGCSSGAQAGSGNT